MNEYTRYSLIRDKRNLKDANVSSLSGVGRSTFSDWKSGRSTPKDEKINKIAVALNVTPEFLKGQTDFTECSMCGFKYDLLDEVSSNKHNEYHHRFIEANNKYPFLTDHYTASKNLEINLLFSRDKKIPLNKRIEYYEKYLEASFCIELIYREYQIDKIDFNDYCKTQIAKLRNDESIEEDFYSVLYDKYGINLEFVDFEIDEISYGIKKDERLQRILKYAMMLNPETLDMLEVQVEALIKKQKGDS